MPIRRLRCLGLLPVVLIGATSARADFITCPLSDFAKSWAGNSQHFTSDAPLDLGCIGSGVKFTGDILVEATSRLLRVTITGKDKDPGVITNSGNAVTAAAVPLITLDYDFAAGPGDLFARFDGTWNDNKAKKDFGQKSFEVDATASTFHHTDQKDGDDADAVWTGAFPIGSDSVAISEQTPPSKPHRTGNYDLGKGAFTAKISIKNFQKGESITLPHSIDMGADVPEPSAGVLFAGGILLISMGWRRPPGKA